jgi:hypothetical protein
MRKPNKVDNNLRLGRASKWLIGTLSLFALATVAFLDYVTGKDLSFTLMYLVPVSVVTWFVGPTAGLVFCVGAAVSGFAVDLADHQVLPTALWNAGVRFGVYIAFFTLLSYLKEHNTVAPVVFRGYRMIAVGVAITCVTLVAAVIIQRQVPLKTSLRNDSSGRAAAAASQGPLGELASVVQQCLHASRPLLLGSRDPNGPSCVTVSHAGDVHEVLPDNPGDLDGGPGTTMATLYYFDRQTIMTISPKIVPLAVRES